MSDLNIQIIGCGFIGKKVAKILVDSNIVPHCYVRTMESKIACESLGFKASQLDLDTENHKLKDETKSGFINSRIVYFLPPQPKGKNDLRMQAFISILENLHNSPKKILLISTTGVYGNCDGEWIDESREVNPQADRAHRRLSAEKQLLTYCDKNKISCIIFRVPGIYSKEKLPIKRITSGEPIVSAEDSGYTNRIHADDLSAFCAEALVEDIGSGIYNCCDGHPSTMNEYFVKVADVMSIPRPAEITLLQAQDELSAGMLSYLAESKRISNKKLLNNFKNKKLNILILMQA